MLPYLGDSMLRFGPLLLAAFGCSDERAIHGSLEVLEANAPARVELGSAVGRDIVTIPISVVNDLGVPVRGSTVDLDVAGACADGTVVTLEASTVAIDASGHGYAHANAPCSTVFAVRATASGDGAETGATVRSYALANVAPIFRMGIAAALPAGVQNPALVAAGTHGIAIGAGAEIWWQGAAIDRPSVRVATLPAPLVGMQSAAIDSDGVLDLVAWGGSVVFLLRGVDGGGYTWEDGFQIADHRITGVAAQDLDGDRYLDLAIAISDDDKGSIEIVTGDGAWAWHTTDVLDTSFPVAGVAADDGDRDGRADLTVLDGDRGSLHRWTQSESGWLEGAPPELIDPTRDGSVPYDAPAGSVLLPLADLDHDGRNDIIVNEPPEGGVQRLVFFVMGADGVTFFHESYDAYYASVADMNQDGADDLLALEDDTLHIIRNDLPTGRFTSQGVPGVGLAAPLVAGNLDADTVADVAIVKGDAAFYAGELVADGDGTLWHALKADWTSFQLGLTGPHAVADTTGDGLADVVGFTTSSADATVLRNWTVLLEKGGPAMSTIGTSVGFDLGGDVTPYDLVHCGSSYYALAGAGVSSELVRFTASSGLVRQATRQVDGTLLACGPLGAATVVVASADGAWTSYDDALTAIDTGEADSTGGIAVADPDGDGTSIVVSCGAPPCAIAVADIDGDGLDEIVRSSSSGLAIEGWATTTQLGGSGALATADVDRDGFVDVLANDPTAGRVLVFRGLKGGLAPALAFHPDESILGAPAAFDTTGDGVPEILAEGNDGVLSISAPSTLAAE
jgi:hypothetical protein